MPNVGLSIVHSYKQDTYSPRRLKKNLNWTFTREKWKIGIS